MWVIVVVFVLFVLAIRFSLRAAADRDKTYELRKTVKAGDSVRFYNGIFKVEGVVWKIDKSNPKGELEVTHNFNTHYMNRSEIFI